MRVLLGRLVLGAGLLVVIACSSSSGGSSGDQGGTHAVAVITVASGFNHPWAVAFAGSDVLVSERVGRLRVVRGGRLLSAPVTGLPSVFASGHGGLLDVITHPDFAQNRLIYFSYATGARSQSTTRVARARYENGALSDLQVIFTAAPGHGSDQHFGSRLVFDRSGQLYVTIGDRQSRDDAQNLMDHAGSVIRVQDDGRMAAGNPFGTRSDARPEIFSYGHRNSQGIALHPDTGAIWASEHGPMGGDEINVLRAGGNYGWPVVTYGVDYDGSPIGQGRERPGMVQPLHVWTPSIAPSGMTFYTGARFPRWRGDLFIGALAGRDLYRLELDGQRVVGEERLLTQLGERIRDVRQGPDGLLWILTDANPGRLLRLEPADTEP
jgi:glucose/arabinose dehydrogenase